MRTYYFDTGVRPENSGELQKGEVWKNDTKHIPFDCENVPNGSRLMFLCNNGDCQEKKWDGVEVRKISNTSLVSDYAYFRVNW